MDDNSNKHDDELSDLIRAHATRHQASQGLQGRVLAELALDTAAGGRRQRVARTWFNARWTWAGLGFIGGALAACLALLIHGPLAASGTLENELVGEHIRSLMVGHLTDVASSDHHTVKPWFQGKLDYSPPVEDFSAEGFPLVGGRLDYVAGKPVAALVYRRRGHLINLFVWPARAQPAGARAAMQGFNLVRWHDPAMQYWLVSDLNAAELEALARLSRQRAQP